MSSLVVTLDIDWACEPAIEDTLDSLETLGISPTVFTTHRSPRIEESLSQLDVGLHPYFDPGSSHGATISDVVRHVMDLPHNLAAFRCHRFAHCNSSRQALAEAGMLLSSNVCTDLEIVAPFRDRFGLLEVPIFLEDGGYLWRKHSLEMNPFLEQKIQASGMKIMTIHPMHFALNTPEFGYMVEIKQSMSREAWKGMTVKKLRDLRWKGRGIRDLLVEVLQMAPKISKLSSLVATG